MKKKKCSSDLSKHPADIVLVAGQKKKSHFARATPYYEGQREGNRHNGTLRVEGRTYHRTSNGTNN